MPRPTAAQFAYGALTVVLTTLAMLLLSQTRSGTGVAVVAVAALALGLLVSLTAATRTSAEVHSQSTAETAFDPPAEGTASPDTRARTPEPLRQ